MQSHNPYPVAPTGFLIGSYLACLLYGIHLTQIHHYFTTYRESLPKRLLVFWVWLLSTLQILIIFGTGWRYFSAGTQDLSVWGEFLWPLSFQDGLIPLMAYTAQLFFGHRAWAMTGRRKWFGWLVVIIPSITMGCGIALAITARLWADDPYVSTLEWEHATRTIGTAATVVAITWMGLSAFTDGGITLILLYNFRTHLTRSPRRLVNRLVSLTLETVLLTHVCGAAMCVIFLASPAQHRTHLDIFWVLLESITELYALSILFTVNARRSLRKAAEGHMGMAPPTTSVPGSPGGVGGESNCVDFGISGVERRVEGYQGDAPFGVPLHVLLMGTESYQGSSRDEILIVERHDGVQEQSGHEGYAVVGSMSGSDGETKAETPGVGLKEDHGGYSFPLHQGHGRE